MNRRELIIGYWYLNEGQEKQLSNNELRDILTCGGEYNWSGIPLTEDWLIKFGFSTNNNGNIFRLEGIEIFFRNPGVLTMVEIEYGHHSEGGVDLPHIEYVHQLQNLYFALTGEELTIKK